MRTILVAFSSNTVLLLFTMITIGTILGKVKFRGISLGSAAILFISMAYAAISYYNGVGISMRNEIGTFGLVLFTFTVGMNAGPNFFKILRKSIFPIITLLIIFLLVAASCYVIGYYCFSMSPPLLGGTFAGALTNTSALSAVGNDPESLKEATVGYALSYVYGVLGMMIFSFMALSYRSKDKDVPEKIFNYTVCVDKDLNLSIGEISKKYGSKVKFPRLAHGEHEHVSLPAEDELLHKGDLVTIVGSEKVVKEVIHYLGHESTLALDADRSEMDDVQRITISNPQFSGRRLKDINIEGKFNATVSRVKRGDEELFADPDLRLQQGDRVRVVVPWNRIKELNEYFGDSVRGLIDINPISLGLGIALGILIGEIPIFPMNGMWVTLGPAVCTMIVGIIFGFLGRVGSLPLAMPYTASQVLSEFGLSVFLVQAGITAGNQIIQAFSTDMWWKILLLGIIVTNLFGLLVYISMKYMFKMGGTRLSGFIAGAQTQTVLVSLANNITKGDPRVVLGYSMSYSVSMIYKIFIGQIMGGL